MAWIMINIFMLNSLKLYMKRVLWTDSLWSNFYRYLYNIGQAHNFVGLGNHREPPIIFFVLVYFFMAFISKNFVNNANKLGSHIKAIPRKYFKHVLTNFKKLPILKHQANIVAEPLPLFLRNGLNYLNNLHIVYILINKE